MGLQKESNMRLRTVQQASSTLSEADTGGEAPFCGHGTIDA